MLATRSEKSYFSVRFSMIWDVLFCVILQYLFLARHWVLKPLSARFQTCIWSYPKIGYDKTYQQLLAYCQRHRCSSKNTRSISIKNRKIFIALPVSVMLVLISTDAKELSKGFGTEFWTPELKKLLESERCFLILVLWTSKSSWLPRIRKVRKYLWAISIIICSILDVQLSPSHTILMGIDKLRTSSAPVAKPHKPRSASGGHSQCTYPFVQYTNTFS